MSSMISSATTKKYLKQIGKFHEVTKFFIFLLIS